MTRPRRIADKRANALAVQRWARLVAAARAGLLGKAATEYVERHAV